jgi:putative ABC transport system permease protein
VVSRYVIRSIRARWASTFLTVIAIASVIGGCVCALCFLRCLHEYVESAGREDNVVVISTGADNLSESTLAKEQVDRVRADIEGVLAKVDGAPLVARESMRYDSGLTMTAIEPASLKIHDKIRVIDGREPGMEANELLIGKAIVGTKPELVLGGAVTLNKKPWKIVGVFTDGGSVFDKQVLASATQMALQLDHSAMALLFRAKSESDAHQVVRKLNEEKGLRVQAWTERDFYEHVTRSSLLLAWVTAVVIVLMAGAGFALTNTLLSSMVARAKEFATLWIIGYRRTRLGVFVLQESLILGVTGAALGGILAFLLAGRSIGDLLGSFDMTLTFGLLEVASTAALGIALGLIGAVLPTVYVLKNGLRQQLK